MSGIQVLIGAIFGLIVGGGAVWFIFKGRADALQTQLAESQKVAQKLSEEKNTLTSERAMFAERASRVEQLELDKKAAEEASDKFRDEIEELRIKGMELEQKMASDERSYNERKAELGKTLQMAETTLKEAFDSMAADALNKSNKQFLELANESLGKFQEQAKGDLDKKQMAIDNIVKPLGESLKKYEENLQRLESEQSKRDTRTEEQIEQLMKGVQNQQSTLSDLKGLFRGPTSRGRVGEIFLKRMLEAAGLEEGLHYDMQVSETTEQGRQRPDCVVRLPSNKALIIDAKTPLNAYQDSLLLDDETARGLKLKEHAANVRREVDSLARRSYTDLNIEADLVVMYLPIEASLNAALQIDPEIMSYGWDRKVVVTTPTLLYALLQIVALDWRQESIRKNAEEITKLGRDMVDRIRIVADHVRKVGTGLRTASESYNKAVSSLERNLLTTAKGFQKLGTGKDVKLESVPEVAAHIDTFNKPEMLILPSPERVAELTLFSSFEIVEDEPSELAGIGEED